MGVATHHDELLVTSDGKLAGYAMGVPNGTSVLKGHAPTGVRASAARRSASPTVPVSAGAPAATPPAPAVPAGPEADEVAVAANREHVRSAAAKLGYLPPTNMDEATYPKEWFAPAERGRLGGAV